MSTKRKCKFSDIGKSKFPCFVKGSDEYSANCAICDCTVDVSNKGLTALERHVNTEKHKQNVRSSASSSKVTNFFEPRESMLTKKVNASAGTLAFHTVKHHQSYKSTDCSVSLMRQLFSDSDIAKNLKCARTKTEAIVNGVLAPHSLTKIEESLKDIAFISVATDASNHKAEKMFPVVLQFFNWAGRGIETKLLDLTTLPDETSETVAQYLAEVLKKHNLGSKVVAFIGDNANVNFGGINRKSGRNVFTRLKQHLNNAGLVGVGCPAHIVHNSVHHGIDQMSIDIESIIMKIFNYFSIYTVRTEALKDFCDYVDTNYQPLLTHSKTRWLSLFPAIERLLHMFPALKEYFQSQEQPPRVIQIFFEDQYSEVYLWFTHALMSAFHTSMAILEREENSVLEVADTLNNLLQLLQNRIRDKFLPLKVKQLISQINNAKRTETVLQEFQQVYVSCSQYIEKWIGPIQKLQVFKWMNLKHLKTTKFEDLTSCIEFLAGKGITIDDVKLYDQYCNLVQFVDNQEKSFFDQMLHKQWCDFFSSCPNIECFSELLTIAQYFFCIAAHNANPERIFSMINSQWSKERGKLCIESVRSIMLTQYNFKEMSCSDFFNYIQKNEALLVAIGKSDKYT